MDQPLNKDQLIQGPNSVNPKTPFNPQHPSDTDHFDLSSYNPQNQNPVTTTSKKPQLGKQIAKSPKISPENLSAKLKRKSFGPELDQLAKRLKNVVMGSEQVYFDPILASFIPCSRLESFILDERKEVVNHGELHPKHFLPSNPMVFDYVFSNSVSTAEEAGLTMPLNLP